MIFCLRDSERRSRQVAGKKEKMRERLIGLSDPEYKEFNDRILNAPSVKTLGIRVPVLRKLAKETAKEMQKEDGWLYEMTRTKGEGIYQEEHMLFGMVAGYRKASRKRECSIWTHGYLGSAPGLTVTAVYRLLDGWKRIRIYGFLICKNG